MCSNFTDILKYNFLLQLPLAKYGPIWDKTKSPQKLVINFFLATPCFNPESLWQPSPPYSEIFTTLAFFFNLAASHRLVIYLHFNSTSRLGENGYCIYYNEWRKSMQSYESPLKWSQAVSITLPAVFSQTIILQLISLKTHLYNTDWLYILQLIRLNVLQELKIRLWISNSKLCCLTFFFLYSIML